MMSLLNLDNAKIDELNKYSARIEQLTELRHQLRESSSDPNAFDDRFDEAMLPVQEAIEHLDVIDPLYYQALVKGVESFLNQEAERK